MARCLHGYLAIGDPMTQESFARRPIRPAVLAAFISLLALMVIVTGCSSTRRNARPSAITTSPGSQSNETSRGLTVDPLVEYGYSFGHRYRAQGSGRLAVVGRDIEWRS